MDDLDVRIADPWGDHLTIHVHGRLHPDATDFWEANWLTTPVSIHLGRFTAEIPAVLRTTDFVRFREELADMYSVNAGSSVLASLDDWLEINVENDGAGHLKVFGTLRDETGSGTGNELSFQLTGLDQTFLPPILSALDDVLLTFPVVEGG